MLVSWQLAESSEMRDGLQEDLLSRVRLKLPLGLHFTKPESCQLQLDIFPNPVISSRLSIVLSGPPNLDHPKQSLELHSK